MEQMLKDVKHPVEWLTMGADLRIRNEYFNNAQTLTANPALNPRAGLHSQDAFRFRSRVWANITATEDLSGKLRLTAEPREWMERSSSGNNRGDISKGQPGNSGFEGRYGIVDNLSANWTNIANLPLRVRGGRQDVYFNADPNENFWGDGWLVADGTPLDGSWTFFLDSARLTYDMPEAHTKINALGILQYAKPDEWMPTIGPSSSAGNPAAYALTDQNEKGAILWIANKSVPEVNVDTYFIYKNDSRINGAATPATFATADKESAAGLFGDNADIYTFGGRLSGLVADHWSYSFEGAYQCGSKYDPWLRFSDQGAAGGTKRHDLSAYGMNSRLSYLFKDKYNNQLFLAYEFLSGDDPKTGSDEMFDVLWGRWPRWSELYAPYSYIPETRTGQMANLYRFGPGWNVTPLKDLDFSLVYNAMWSEQNTPTRANAPGVFSFNDNFRGHYLQAILKYKFSKHCTGHLWTEFVFPGHFYQETDQILQFLRAELWFML